MPIDFNCPHCGKWTNVADQYAGASGPCASCGQTIAVPAAGEPPVKMSPSPIPPKSSSRSRGTLVVTLASTILPLLLCGGVLAALIIPAIQAAREAARRTQCNNNLKWVALGLQNYHDTYKTFPSGAWHAGTAGESERIGPSWWFAMMPFMQCDNMYDKVRSLQRPERPGNGAFNAENLDANMPGGPLARYVPDYMRCPSSSLPPMETPTGPICLPSYVGISGGCDIAANSPDYAMLPGQMAPTSAQVYLNQRKGTGHTPGGILTVSGMLPACEQLNMAQCTDGTSNTMIVGEQSDWLRDVDPSMSTKYHGDAGWDTSGTGPPAPSTTAGGGFISGTVQTFIVPPAQNGLPGVSPAPYDCYNLTTVRYQPDLKRVLGIEALPGCDEDHGINNPLQSAHPGGILVAFVDGSVQFIATTTELSILLRIAIRDEYRFGPSY